MSVLRPTTLKLGEEHCPRALDFYEDNVPYDRSIYAVGTAAHELLYSIATHGLESVDTMVHRLIQEGRRGFDPEPPLPPNAVFKGRDLALKWTEVHGFPVEQAWFERMFAVDKDWQPCAPDSPETHVQTRIDQVFVDIDEDEEFCSTGLNHLDYKSAWSAGPEWLETLQRKVQALVVYAHRADLMSSEPEFIRSSVGNLRTLNISSAEVWADSFDETLRHWRMDIDLLIRALKRPAGGDRPASPGVCCVGCPYVNACPAFQAFSAVGGYPETPVAMVAQWAAARASQDSLWGFVRAACNEGPIETPTGTVGFFPKEQRAPLPDAGQELLEAWTSDVDLDSGSRSSLRGLMLAAEPSVGTIEKIAKKLYPGRGREEMAERREFVASLVTTTTVRRFEIKRDTAADDTVS